MYHLTSMSSNNYLQYSNSIEFQDIQHRLKDNQKYKQSLKSTLPNKTYSFKGKYHSKIIVKKTMKIHPGRYCYHLGNNYMASKNETNFTRYYGEETIDEIFKKKKGSNKEMPDDLLSNLKILLKIKQHKDIKELKKAIKPLITMNYFYLKALAKRLGSLYDRYHSLFTNEEMTFVYMSCLSKKPLSYESILDSNKKLYCSICHLYDCNIHDYPKQNFDNPDGYNVKQYLRTYKEINETSLTIKNKDNNDNRYDSNEIIENDDFDMISHDINGDLIAANDFDKRIITNCEKFNGVIQDYSLSHYCGYINLYEPKSLMTGRAKSQCCSKDYCYFSYLTLDINIKLRLYKMFINKQLPPILEIYFEKLVQIYKYDPCAISNALMLVLNPIKNNTDKDDDSDDIVIDINATITTAPTLTTNSTTTMNDTNNDINIAPLCYIIYLRLISNDLRVCNILNKTLINGFIKEKASEKKHVINPHILKLIKSNLKKNKVIPYQPCHHMGNEICNDTCPCASRGFCEKYCACNKSLCKLNFKGCHCKGTCNRSLCPCYLNNRECDIDICQSKLFNSLCYITIDCKQEYSTCLNRKLQMGDRKCLGVGDSTISGWGVYAKEFINKDELIGEYVGEMIDMNTLNDRSEYIDYENATYMFTLNEEITVDSRTMGNILRFANHSKSNSNAYTRIIFADGQHRICMYASEDIPSKKEIFFDYDGQNILCDKYDWINDNTQVKSTTNVFLKANKTVSFLGNKRKMEKNMKNEEEEEERLNNHQKKPIKIISEKNNIKIKQSLATTIAKSRQETYSELIKYHNKNKKQTKDELKQYCLDKGLANIRNIEKYLNKFQKTYNIKFAIDNTNDEHSSDFEDINQTYHAFLDNSIEAYTSTLKINENQEAQVFYHNEIKTEENTDFSQSEHISKHNATFK